MGFAMPPARAGSGGLLHHLFTLTVRKFALQNGGIFSAALSVETPRGVIARVYLRRDRSYAASRPVEFGLSSSAELLQQKRFSALPKPAIPYE